MIERKFVQEKIKEFEIMNYVGSKIDGAGHSTTQLKRTPLGDKVEVHAAKPGFVVGRKGENIREITEGLKKNFDLENPQVEIVELKDPMLDARVVGERISNSLERFGLARFKRIGYSTMEQVMKSGALGVEILMSGKIPSARARTWPFYQGYMKKSGSVAQYDVDAAYARAELKTGVVGIQIKIMRPDIKLPDDIQLIGEEESDVQKRVEAAKASGAVAGGVDEVEVSEEVNEEAVQEIESGKTDKSESVPQEETAEPKEATEKSSEEKTEEDKQ